MRDLPSGTLTFLFTDVEGSSARWERNRTAMRDALRRHDAIVRRTLEAHAGIVLEAVGDAFHAVFERAEDAAACASDLRDTLDAEDWSAVDELPVRIALHAGSAVANEGRYAGAVVDAVKVLVALCHGGQTVVSQTVAMLLANTLPPELSLAPLGSLELDGERPTEIFQLEPRASPRRFPAFRDPSHPPTNLPRPFTSFIGRAAELAELRALLAESRVVTIVGPGGVGKTRTALALAADVRAGYPDGVFFISFASIEDAATLAEATTTALAIGERHARTAREALVDYFAKRRVLLVFDNCEHVVEAAADLVGRLERSCPNVTVIATSREALRTPGERAYALHPFAVPVLAGQLPSLEGLENSPAVALFLERARTVSQGMRYEAPERRAVAQLCVHLDGLPLAIELAAARSNVFPPSVMAELIERRFEVLPPLPAGGTSPHRTLHGLVAWSYDLLSEQEQMLFRRLAIFSGGWTIEQAETVASGNGLDGREIFGLLANLYDKSLITRPGDDDDRFAFLETIRAYALEVLENSSELSAARRAHVEYFALLTSHAEPSLRSSAQHEWIERLSADADNIRAALDATENDPALAAAGNVMCACLVRYWVIRGAFREGRARLARAVERTEFDPAMLVRALCGAAVIALNEIRGDDFLTFAERARIVADDVTDRWTIAYAAVILATARAYATASGASAAEREKRDEAIADARRSAEETGDPWLLSHVSSAEIFKARSTGADDVASAREEEALANAERSGDRVLIAQNAVHVAYRLRTIDPARSLSLLERASRLLVSSHALILASCLECVVEIAFDARHFDDAARFMSAARGNRRAAGLPSYRLDPDAHRDALSEALGNGRFPECEREGEAWTFEGAVAAVASYRERFSSTAYRGA